jgi:protein involved in polysaccharide export with SLBB domain
MPGTYTLPSFATAFNALYMAGGPAEKGSFREISVIRDGEVVTEIDLYDFLLKGETRFNIRMQDEDLIFIGPYKNQAIISGEVKRPAIYEMLEDETLEDLIDYSGGFTADAFKKRLQVDRKTDTQRTLLNVESTLFSSFLLRNGDSIPVGKILDRYENRVTISGAVWREGEYELTEGMTINGLISRAEGLKEDAFMNRAAIYRLQDNLQLEVIDINLQRVLNGEDPDITLKREDMVMISSVTDLQPELTVRIIGELNSPGTFKWSKFLTLGELIRLSGGLSESASLARVEVARRVVDQDAVRPGDRVTEVFSFPLDPGLSLEDKASSFELKPFDIVFVRRSPGYKEQVLAQVRGEVNFPGSYAITKRSERISDLVIRAGGITGDAYLAGATLNRRVDTAQVSKLDRMSVIDTSEATLDLREIAEIKTQAIGIDLEKILRVPYGSDDLFLEEGDVLVIPKELQTVRLNGALLYPVTTRYQDRMGMKRYISQAGGFASNASKTNVFVVYANGSVDQTRNFLFFRSYPPVKPGAEIFVPQKPEKQSRTLQETLAVSSALTSIALVIVTLVRQF